VRGEVSSRRREANPLLFLCSFSRCEH